MNEILEILYPSYVLRNALYGGMVTGLVLPFVGVLMYARRMVFLGVVLPQLSATGIAAAVYWHLVFHVGDPVHSDFVLALVGATIVTTGVLMLLASLERKGFGLVEGRIGVVYVLAGAMTILLLASEHIPEVGVIQLLRGQIIAISDTDLLFLISFYAGIMALLWYFRKELLLISVDRDMALSLGKRAWVWDLLLYGLVGTSISLGVLMVGPLLTFAFLLLPPMIALRVAGRFYLIPLLAGIIGAAIGFSGFLFSYFLDWPTGATDAFLACILLGLIVGIQWFRHRISAVGV